VRPLRRFLRKDWLRQPEPQSGEVRRSSRKGRGPAEKLPRHRQGQWSGLRGWTNKRIIENARGGGIGFNREQVASGRIFPKPTVRRVNRTVRRTQWKIAGTLGARENRSRIRAGAVGAALAKIEERLPRDNQTQGRQKRDQRELHAIHLCFDTRFHWAFIWPALALRPLLISHSGAHPAITKRDGRCN